MYNKSKEIPPMSTKEILSRCGYRCDLCLAYKPNIESKDQRDILSAGWKKVFDINLSPDQIYCEGCVTRSDNNLTLIDHDCPVRPCATQKDHANCAQCDEFIQADAQYCPTLKDSLVSYDNLTQTLDFDITPKLRKNCIEPYENLDRLTKLIKNKK